MTKCVNCGKDHAHYVQDFLVVSRSNDGFHWSFAFFIKCLE